MDPIKKEDLAYEHRQYAQELYFFISELLGTAIHSLKVEVTADEIVLLGTCDTFHTKQRAQEIVRRITTGRSISNRIVVSESPA